MNLSTEFFEKSFLLQIKLKNIRASTDSEKSKIGTQHRDFPKEYFSEGIQWMTRSSPRSWVYPANLKGIGGNSIL